MPDYNFGGLLKRIRQGAPTPERNYGAEVEASIQRAAIVSARNNIIDTISMIQRDTNLSTDTVLERLWEAHHALS